MTQLVKPTDLTQCFTSTNASAMTLAGTNTYLVSTPEATEAVLVDPGDESTQQAQFHAVSEALRGRKVALILVTHWHPDHSGAVDYFAEHFGCPVRAVDPGWCRDATPLQPGEIIHLAGTRIECIATPGHTSDSMSFYLPEDSSVITGDTILGEGTTMLDHPDGSLADYLDTLTRLADLETTQNAQGAVRAPVKILPAHGPDLDSVAVVAQRLFEHRVQRVHQIAELLGEYDPETTPSTAGWSSPVSAQDPRILELSRHLYPGLDEMVLIPAQRTVAAAVQFLLYNTQHSAHPGNRGA